MKQRGSDKIVVIISLVCFIGLGVLGAVNYTKEDIYFYLNGGDVYYQGREIADYDPHDEYWSQIDYGKGDDTCKVQADILGPTERIMPYGSGLPWIQTKSDVDLTTVENDYCKKSEFTPYEDGQLIICPGSGMFLTSNTSHGVGDETIEVQIGTDWKVTFKCVQSWYCHLDSNHDCTHTEVIGAGATNGSDKAHTAAILGRASASTIVYVERKIDDEWTPSTFEEFYKS